MKNLKEYIITEARNLGVILTSSAFQKFMSGTVYTGNEMIRFFGDWYNTYGKVLIKKCKSSAISTPFTLKLKPYIADGGIAFKGLDGNTITEFLYQLDSVFDSMKYDPKFSHLNLKLTREGLSMWFRYEKYWDAVEAFCNKINL